MSLGLGRFFLVTSTPRTEERTMTTATAPKNVRGRGTTVELERRTYRATLTGEIAHRGIGPAVLEIVISQTTREDGVVCRPSYSARIDGTHQFGGFAEHLDEDGLPKLLGPLEPLLLVGEELEHATSPAPGSVRDRTGAPCPAASSSSYPLAAVCNGCARPIICSDGSADWTHDVAAVLEWVRS